jgi:hypothetical protein
MEANRIQQDQGKKYFKHGLSKREKGRETANSAAKVPSVASQQSLAALSSGQFQIR